MALALILVILFGFQNCLISGGRSFRGEQFNISPYIVGGFATTIEEHPYQALLEMKNSNGAVSKCAAVIISPNVLLTAAHCVYSRKPEALEVFVGFTSTKMQPPPIKVRDARPHPLYNGGLDFDIAAIQIEGRFKFSRSVRMIELAPADYKLVPGTLITTTGWGSTQATYTEPAEILQEVSIPIIPWHICRDMYLDKRDNRYPLDRKSFCAADLKGGLKDSCKGDSGSAATQDGYLVGIVSWGVGCGSTRSPGVYSSTIHFRRWIEAVVAYFELSSNEGYKRGLRL